MIYFKYKSGYSAMILISAICTFILPSAIYAGTGESLTAEYLVSGSWGPEFDVGMKVKFTADGHFDSNTNYGQDGCTAEGKYTIKSGKLSLSMEKSKSGPFCGVMTLKLGTLCTEPVPVKYRRYILFNSSEVKGLYMQEDLKIWDYNSIVKEGEALSINGLNVLAMGMKKAVTTAAVRVRETPGVNGKEIHFSFDDECGSYVTEKSDNDYTVKSVKKDYPVTVLARTKEKDKVGKLSNYWYFVEFAIENRGWVYGEFIKIK